MNNTLFPPKYTHRQLVEVAYKWILKTGRCGFAFKELKSIIEEIPDVIGFNSWGQSTLIEVKVSRSDFLADKRKTFREDPGQGMGTYRYYLCPSGMVKPEELPEGWGLIYVNDKLRATMVVRAKQRDYSDKNHHAEHCMLYSALRRLHIRGRMDEIYLGHPDFQDNVKQSENE